jgi:hypothetical protein
MSVRRSLLQCTRLFISGVCRRRRSGSTPRYFSHSLSRLNLDIYQSNGGACCMRACVCVWVTHTKKWVRVYSVCVRVVGWCSGALWVKVGDPTFRAADCGELECGNCQAVSSLTGVVTGRL